MLAIHIEHRAPFLFRRNEKAFLNLPLREEGVAISE